MVLPVGVAKLGELRGERGRPGTFDSVSAESLPSGAAATATITGDEGEHLHLGVPRGLPGVNAVPADTAVGGYVTATDSATSAALHSRFPVYRVWDGATYPTRVTGAMNLFIGPVDPGLAMGAGDHWADSNVTTLDTVASQIGLTGTAVRAAVVDAATSESIYLSAQELGVQNNETSILPTILGASPNMRRAWLVLPGVVSRIYGGFKIPTGWTQVKIRVHWQHATTSPTAGNVQFVTALTSSPFTGGVSATTLSASGGRDVLTVAESGVVTVPANRYMHLALARNGANAADTFAYNIAILGAEIVRVA